MTRVCSSSLSIALALSAVVLIATARTAVATPVTYNYSGNNYTLVYSTSPYTTAESVSISLTLSAALPANATDFDASSSVLSVTFQDGQQAFSGPALVASEFLFTTDAAGAITEWAVWGQTASTALIISCNVPSGTITDSLVCAPTYVMDEAYLGHTGEDAYAYLVPGTWTVAVPEPASGLLVASGLALLSTRMRRRTQR